MIEIARDQVLWSRASPAVGGIRGSHTERAVAIPIKNLDDVGGHVAGSDVQFAITIEVSDSDIAQQRTGAVADAGVEASVSLGDVNGDSCRTGVIVRADDHIRKAVAVEISRGHAVGIGTLGKAVG